MENKITIFTPTYNRENLLKNLYKSLCVQTNKNFVWLIIDDGSKDNTENVVFEMKKEAKININYIKKENGGKHTAMDLAHSICETEYIACVDSDDYLTENAIEEIYSIMPKMNESSCFGAVLRKSTTSLVPFNEKWPEDQQIFFYELSTKYGYNEDTFLIFKTDIISKVHFPKILDERFITEKVLYNQVYYNYTLYASKKLIYIAEYQEDGYTSGALNLMFKNPKGLLYAFKSDAYYLTKYNIGFKQSVMAWARFYAWRRINKFKDLYKEEFNIKSCNKFAGWILSFVMQIRYMKKKKIFTKGN